MSKMIKSMMQSSGGFSERRNNKITFPEISGKILEKVCQYFYYKLQYTDSRDSVPEFKSRRSSRWIS